MREGLLILFLLPIIGCSLNPMLNVTYYSDPAGAEIVMGGVNHGQSPVTLTYEISEHPPTDQMTLEGGYAKWISGTTTRVPDISINLSSGRNQQFTFRRSNNVSGLDIDLGYAEKETERTRSSALLSCRKAKVYLKAVCATNYSPFNCGGAFSRYSNSCYQNVISDVWCDSASYENEVSCALSGSTSAFTCGASMSRLTKYCR